MEIAPVIARCKIATDELISLWLRETLSFLFQISYVGDDGVQFFSRMEKNQLVTSATEGLRYVGAKILAQRYSLHPKTILLWGRRGWITPHKLNGRVVRFNVAEADAFMNQNRID
ncbi:hypothetical protein [Geminisphaera colitermitum]|uniref:hypothetical protein n=1 Tax=Geminisphaera colitermitum TaxID=1148786 RepID=UPI0005BAF1A8|nr:hypothetical protein [Geminisphaera colitermitum]